MVSILNQYVSNIELIYDDITKNIILAALKDNSDVDTVTVLIKNNKFIVDIHLKEFTIEHVTSTMNRLMDRTRFPYSAFFIRYNEGNQVRYRYATCKENKQGFYCDVVFN